MNNKLTIPVILAAMMFFAVVIRGPFGPGEARVWFAIYFEIALAMSLAAVIWHYNPWIASFLIMVTVSMFWPYHGKAGYFAGRAVFNGCAWYLFIMMFFNTSNLNMLYKTMRIITYFHVFVAAVQAFGVGGILQRLSHSVGTIVDGVAVTTPVGLMGNPLELAALISFCIPAFLVLKGRWILLIAIPVIGLLITKQFLGFVALGSGIVFYLAAAHRMYWPIIPIVIAAILWSKYIDAPGVNLRLEIWKKAILVWKRHWVTGFGIGNWKAVMLFNPQEPLRAVASDGTGWFTTHNEFLQMLFELGIGSAIIFIGYAVDVARKMTRKAVIPLTALVMITVHCVVSFPFHIAPTAMIAVTWMAVLQIVINEVQTRNVISN